jgi:hypothetical protein
MKLQALLIATLLGWSAPLGAAGPELLSMRVSPTVAFAPASVIVRAIVEAHDRNRAIEIIAESEQFYRSSEVPLEGDRAPRVSQFEFRGLPGGAYAVVAILKGVNDEIIAVRRGAINIVDGPLER